MTAVVLYGPTAAGKSQVARQLALRAGAHHVDTDELVLHLLGRGVEPHPDLGWLAPVEREVRRALRAHRCVSVEATGAWPSDWLLADRLAADGVRVLRVRVTAPLEVTLARLAARTAARVPVTAEEAARRHLEGGRQAAARTFDAVLDTTTDLDPHALDALVRLLA